VETTQGQSLPAGRAHHSVGSYHVVTLACTALHCTALTCTALHCTGKHCLCLALHCTALHCTALHCTALHCTAMPGVPRMPYATNQRAPDIADVAQTPIHGAVQCSAMQCSAVLCSAVQCSAVQCSAVQCSDPRHRIALIVLTQTPYSPRS
jgi:hypothetical protein